MKLGIKVGLQKDSLNDLNQTHPEMAEVWFDVNRQNEYTELFEALKRQGCDVGLHYWAALADGTMSNLTYPNKILNSQSASLIKKTLDIAYENGFSYVNIHPGSLATIKVDFKQMDYPYVSEPAALTDGLENFITNITPY